MKACTCEKYGPPEVLTKVNATTVNAVDFNLRVQSFIPSGPGFLVMLMLGIKKPGIPVIGSVLALKIHKQ